MKNKNIKDFILKEMDFHYSELKQHTIKLDFEKMKLTQKIINHYSNLFFSKKLDYLEEKICKKIYLEKVIKENKKEYLLHIDALALERSIVTNKETKIQEMINKYVEVSEDEDEEFSKFTFFLYDIIKNDIFNYCLSKIRKNIEIRIDIKENSFDLNVYSNYILQNFIEHNKNHFEKKDFSNFKLNISDQTVLINYLNNYQNTYVFDFKFELKEKIIKDLEKNIIEDISYKNKEEVLF